jgi:hypothetical protein
METLTGLRCGCSITRRWRHDRVATWIFLGIPGKELVELAQGKLRAPISVTQAPLELQEAAQLAGDGAVENLVHRGTGSPTLRRRFSATRTYTDVEEELRCPKISLTTLRFAPASTCLLAWLCRKAWAPITFAATPACPA